MKFTRQDKEQRLKQRSKVIWLTGLSGSGKTALANALHNALFSNGFLPQVLDGDEIRTGLSNNLSFKLSDRKENIRRVAETSKLLINSGIITICSFISPTRDIRDLAKNIIGENNFIEVFVKRPIEECKGLDSKGLYQEAKKGKIQNFTGLSSPYEEPNNPFIILETAKHNLDECITKLMELIIPQIEYKYE